MAAPVSEEKFGKTGFYIRIDAGSAEKEADYALLLDALKQHTRSQAAVFYAFQRLPGELKAIAVRSSRTARVKEVGLTLGLETSKWLESLASPAQGNPASDRWSERFPEVLQYQLRSLLVIPLRTEKLLGLLTLGRTEETPFDPIDIGVALQTGKLLNAVLERLDLQRELAERKLVERAKGLLQKRKRLSEEQAYLMLRNDSRRRRIPMATVASEIIEAVALNSAVRNIQVAS